MSRSLENNGWIIDPGYWGASHSNNNVQTHNHIRRDTGLLDHKGRSIFKEPNGIGFGAPQDTYSVR